MKRERYVSKFTEYRYRFGKGNCGYCGKKLTGHQRYWCEGNICVQAMYLLGHDWQATRREVFKRDNHKCVKCGRKSGQIIKEGTSAALFLDRIKIELQADHIKPVELYPELQWNLDNLQTLCQFCHRIKTKQDVSDIAAKRRGTLSPSGTQTILSMLKEV